MRGSLRARTAVGHPPDGSGPARPWQGWAGRLGGPRLRLNLQMRVRAGKGVRVKMQDGDRRLRQN